MPARRGANTSLSRSSPTMSIWARGTASRATTASQNRASAFLRPRSRKQKISATKGSSATRAKAADRGAIGDGGIRGDRDAVARRQDPQDDLCAVDGAHLGPERHGRLGGAVLGHERVTPGEQHARELHALSIRPAITVHSANAVGRVLRLVRARIWYG